MASPTLRHKFCAFSLFLLTGFFLSGCQSALLKNVQMDGVNEQLYIDAKLNFAIKHPLNWKLIQTPVSSPHYRDDTVRWKIENPHKETDSVGNMLIQSLPGNDNTDLPDLLSHFLADKPELTSGRAENFAHPAGPALKFIGHDADRGLLTIALLGKQHNFIISLDYASSHFEELLPVFQDITDSFSEIIRPDSYPKPGRK